MRKLVVLVFTALMVQGTSTALAQQSGRASLRHPRTATQTRAERRKARIQATLAKLNQSVEVVEWEDEVLEDLINDFFKVAAHRSPSANWAYARGERAGAPMGTLCSLPRRASAFGGCQRREASPKS